MISNRLLAFIVLLLFLQPTLTEENKELIKKIRRQAKR
jgi:hypothetical protein